VPRKGAAQVANQYVFSQAEVAVTARRLGLSGTPEAVMLRLPDEAKTRQAVRVMLGSGRVAQLVDVDDCFDDPSADWRNDAVATWLAS